MQKIKTINLRYLTNVNSYLIKTDKGFILIDTGYSANRKELEKQLETEGCRLGDLKLIIITHGHLDHNGNTAYLREKFGAKIAMHSEDVKMAESGDMFWGKKDLTIKIVKMIMFLLRLNRFDSFKPDILLEDGQDLSDYGLDAKVLHIPGHSKGSIGILTTKGDLICGDLLENTKRPAKNTLIDDSMELDSSIEKLKKLNINTVYPGHGKQFSMDQLNGVHLYSTSA